MTSKILDPLATYLGHIECNVCHNFGHMAKDCNIPRSLRLLVQKKTVKEECTSKEPSKEHMKEKGASTWKVWHCTLLT